MVSVDAFASAALRDLASDMSLDSPAPLHSFEILNPFRTPAAQLKDVLWCASSRFPVREATSVGCGRRHGKHGWSHAELAPRNRRFEHKTRASHTQNKNVRPVSEPHGSGAEGSDGG
eukprot:3621101-Rhodomonas_salina.1